MAERGVEVRFNVIDTTHFESFEPIFEEEMTPVMTVITNKVLGDAETRAPVDRNFFRGSMQSLVEAYIKGSAKVTGRVVATAPHAAVLEAVDEQGNEVEFGRRPGAKFPPLDQLRVWVERHIAPDQLLNLEDDDEEIDQITFLVGRAIARRGLRPELRTNKPGRPIGDAFRANAEFIDKEIQLGIDRTLNRL
ncbi:MAG: hypothetical protein AABN33_18435 [Acidobacteriota bacterium]